MKLQLVSYARCSIPSDGSLEAQLEKITDWAAKQGHELVATYRDNGVSGTKEEWERPGLRQALAEVGDGLVVHRLDRLARALHVQEAILSKVWEQGGKVFEVVGGEVQRDDPDDPYRTFVRQVMGQQPSSSGVSLVPGCRVAEGARRPGAATSVAP